MALEDLLDHSLSEVNEGKIWKRDAHACLKDATTNDGMVCTLKRKDFSSPRRKVIEHMGIVSSRIARRSMHALLSILAGIIY